MPELIALTKAGTFKCRNCGKTVPAEISHGDVFRGGANCEGKKGIAPIRGGSALGKHEDENGNQQRRFVAKAATTGMNGWQHYDGDYPHYRRRKGTREYLIHPIKHGPDAGKHGLESHYTGSAGPGGNSKTHHGTFDTPEAAASHVETLRNGKPVRKGAEGAGKAKYGRCEECGAAKRVAGARPTAEDEKYGHKPALSTQHKPGCSKAAHLHKLADLVADRPRTLGTALGIEKKKDSPVIAESGPVTLHHNQSLSQHEVHHAEHGLVATIHDVGASRHPKGTHMISPRGSLSDTMGANETRPSLISAFEHVAGHARNLPSQSEIGERLKNSEGGTDHHYGIASRHVMGQAFEAKNGQYRHHPPNHVIEHKGFVHEYYDDGGSHVGVHINTKTGTQHVSFHPGVTSAIDAHAEAMSGRGSGRPQRATHGSPHPGRAYRDPSGIATHEYYPAKDRAGFYGTHLSYFPNTSVAEAPRGDSTAYGGTSSSPNHDYHVSYHPHAKSHDEAHMQYLKARGVVKSADGGEVPAGESEIEKAADYSDHSLQIHTVDRKGLKFAQPHCSCGWKGRDDGHAFRMGAYVEHEKHVAAETAKK